MMRATLFKFVLIVALATSNAGHVKVYSSQDCSGSPVAGGDLDFTSGNCYHNGDVPGGGLITCTDTSFTFKIWTISTSCT
jgi:hypothetical protein